MKYNFVWWILIITLNLLSCGNGSDFSGKFCSKRNVVKAPPPFSGELWRYDCITLEADSTCKIVNNENGGVSLFNGKWTQLSNNQCKIYGVVSKGKIYNGDYELDGDKLVGNEPNYGVYVRDFAP